MLYQSVRFSRLLLQNTIRYNCITSRSFNCSPILFSGKKFSKDHEWVTLDGNIARFGITHFAQDKLGEVVFVELPEVGDEVVKDDVVGTVESVKAASDIFSPLSGVISQVNPMLADKPTLINDSAEQNGWMVEMEVKSSEEFDTLLSEQAYNDFVRDE